MRLAKTLNYLGEFAAAQAHLAQGIALYDPQRHRAHAVRYGQDPGVVCRACAGVTLWHLGYPDQALQMSHGALTLAQEVAHPFSQGMALFFAAWWSISAVGQGTCRRAGRGSYRPRGRAGGDGLLSGGDNLSGVGAGPAVSCAWCREGAKEARIAQMQRVWRPVVPRGQSCSAGVGLALLAAASAQGGQPETGVTLLAEALSVLNDTGERRHEADSIGLRARYCRRVQQSTTGRAETCFQQALALARWQQARAWELRVAMSLSRLWQQQGTPEDARQLLTGVYDWFTERLQTPDLQEARALFATWSVLMLSLLDHFVDSRAP